MKATKWENGGEEGSNDKALPMKFPYLPQDMITEILLRLDARSLGRFRCVSKPFCSLLSDPTFAKKHVDHNTVRFGHRRLIISSYNNLYAVNCDSIRDGRGGIRDLTAVELDYPLKEDELFLSKLKPKVVYNFKSNRNFRNTYYTTYTRRPVHIFGSSNGKLESKKLPYVVGQSRRSTVSKSGFSYGFGFDSLTNDYKVVKLFDCSENVDNYVYSLKTDSWRRICNMPYKEVPFTSSVELNGSIHWIPVLGGEETQNEVTAFDLNTEKLRVISIPDLGEGCEHNYGRCIVSTLKGRLCVVHWCFKIHDVIWVMNEYGVESSWTKIRINVSFESMKPQPLCSTKNDEAVLLLDGHLVLYNFERSTWRTLKIRGVESGNTYTYVESLISPNSYGIV
ncbi:PREDICTED: F-box/kelch-repeat protein At3g06240-like [Camelina sativa]|uniref:F-box/kelch-repeat protein At3g06240-like n=1 Tax=Camelina sativa TaxID=90675 RepID=A0ABM0V6C6_CAMSA|nr:PREDICTED: F-box/kelch-repeat protein At3g06240-like [Camelina sativa]